VSHWFPESAIPYVTKWQNPQSFEPLSDRIYNSMNLILRICNSMCHWVTESTIPCVRFSEFTIFWVTKWQNLQFFEPLSSTIHNSISYWCWDSEILRFSELVAHGIVDCATQWLKELQILSLSDLKDCGFCYSVIYGIADSESQIHELWILSLSNTWNCRFWKSHWWNCRFCYSVWHMELQILRIRFMNYGFCHLVTHRFADSDIQWLKELCYEQFHECDSQNPQLYMSLSNRICNSMSMILRIHNSVSH
jgi:hypothetical protein